MTANDITLQSALIKAPAEVAPAEPAVVEPVVAPAVSSVPARPPYGILALVATILLLVGAGLVLRRRTVRQTSA
jgi:hypothetical protein